MAWGDSFDNFMGGGLLGDLTEEEKRRLRMQAMGAMGAGLLDASGWSQTPVTLGQGLASGIANGQAAYQQGAAQLSQLQHQRQQRDAALAKQQQETEARAELERIIASGEQLTPQQAMRIVALAPSLSNVVQQAMKPQEGPKETLPLSAIGKQVYDMGVRPDTPEWKQAYSQALAASRASSASSASSGEAKPTTKQQDYQFLIANGVAPGEAMARVFGSGRSEEGGKEARASGNPRQVAGREVRNSAALDYAANLTGLPKEELRSLAPAEVANLIRERGKRNMQGGVARFIGGIPLIGEGIVNSVNSDLVPFSSQMATGQVSVNNPAGDTGEKAFDLAARQVPTPQMDLETQAQLIEKMLAEAQGSAAPAPAGEAGALTPEQARAELERRRRARGQ